MIDYDSSMELVLVVHVPRDSKVLCQAKGCGRAVFREVHVVEHIHISQNFRKIAIYGSCCAKKLFGTFKSGSHASRLGLRVLQARDVEQLLANTEAFIASIENMILKRETVDLSSTYVKAPKPTIVPNLRYEPSTPAEFRSCCLRHVRELLVTYRGLSHSDLPRFSGFVNFEAEKLVKEAVAGLPLPEVLSRYTSEFLADNKDLF